MTITGVSAPSHAVSLDIEPEWQSTGFKDGAKPVERDEAEFFILGGCSEGHRNDRIRGESKSVCFPEDRDNH